MLIKKGNIHAVGKVFKGWDVQIKGGTIVSVAKDIIADTDEEVIDTAGLNIFPGFIDPVVYLGTLNMGHAQHDNVEDFNPLTPELDIKYSFNAEELMYQRYYEAGITSVGLSPAAGSIVGGHTALCRTYGEGFEDMMVKSPVALRMSVCDSINVKYNGSFPATKMAIIGKIRNLLSKAEKVTERDENKISNELRPFVKVLKKELKLFAEADRESDIRALLNITADYDLDMVITGGYGACGCVDVLIDRNVSLILGDLTAYSQGVISKINLRELVKAEKHGLRLCVSTTGIRSTAGKVTYLWNICELLKAGMDSERALNIASVNPACVSGAGHILGAIERGMAADLVIFDGNPFESYASCLKYAIIGGRVVYSKGGEIYAAD